MDTLRNSGAAPHTVKVFDEDLHQLRAKVCELGGRSEEAIRRALDALALGHTELAGEVIRDDAVIDAQAAEVERQALTLIALRGPLADDLRDVLASLKISVEVARIGDCARNIARRALLVENCRRVEQMKIIPAMGRTAAEMVMMSLDAFARRDPAAADRVALRDDEVDASYDMALRALIDHMAVHPSSITAAIHLVFVAQNLERIGDHATNIARIVRFAVTGESAGAAA